MPKELPPVAQVEDYDSDAGVARPDTRVQARRATASSRPATAQHHGPVERERERERFSRREIIKDAGSTSQPYATQAQNTAAAKKPKSKPLIHRADSHQDSRTKAPPARSPSLPRRNSQCQDPKCAHPTCTTVRNLDRRYTIHTPQYSVPYSATPPPQLPPPPQHHYSSYHQSSTGPTVEVPGAISRPRRLSLMNARPVSFHGYSPSQYGPPPAPSAYYHPNHAASYYPQPQQYPQQTGGYRGIAPPVSNAGFTSVPLNPSPTSSIYPQALPNLPQNFSARQTQPEASTYVPPQSQLTRTISARQMQPSARILPESYPQESSESESQTDSEDERYEREYQRNLAERQLSGRHVSRRSSSHTRDRDRELMPPPPRRPSITSRYTSSQAITSTPREGVRRTLRSDSDLDYSSDYVDSDRTHRAVVDRRTDSSYSDRSRRPSLSSHASSGRTKATTVSSGSGSGSRNYVLEDRHGRQMSYLSKTSQAELIRRMEREKRADRELQERIDLQDRVEAYQREVRGAQPVELTAENIHNAQDRRTSGSHSHVTTRTRRSESHASSKSKGTNSDGIKIQSGDTVLHVYGDAKIEMRTGEDGGPAQFIIDNQSPNGKEKSYYSGKSNSSRAGRTAAESEKGSKGLKG
ncbi:Hypothetical protein R9X50_00782600 [Acrodontium crateriforme]|uniref:Uncharacterized protein n=1 Tax=Acrodontium crateriforme TaxID=150365 RepID=A0AAQ3MBS4_9PEZI|nr:Hypothetical protein R9X50_00782600 [Acrodontium crateriforme]